jgi:hypothetical protein
MSSTQPTQTSNATNDKMYFMSRTCMAPSNCLDTASVERSHSTTDKMEPSKDLDTTSVGRIHPTTDKMAPSKNLDITSVGRSHATNDKMYFMSRTCMAPSNVN